MAKESFIKIRGARVHNLKNVNVNIPKDKLVVVTGISGSGKSSLAFDTLYAEGQRRYVESLSAYARQFLGVMKKPDVDKIEGISPAISIDQRKAAHNPRSTVGTITEIYDYLRLLFARIGKPHCPKCGKLILRQTIDQIVEQVLSLPKQKEILILGPVIRSRKGEHKGILEEIQRSGFIRVRINGILHRTEEALQLSLNRNKKHNIEVVVDRLDLSEEIDRPRLVDSLETGLKLGKGVVIVNGELKVESRKLKTESGRSKQRSTYKVQPSNDLVFSEHFACEKCGISLPELEPRLFSFNSPFGACPACQGLGEKLEVNPELVIPNKNLTINEGAIMPWAYASHKVGRQGYFWWKLHDLSQRHNFSLDIPVSDLKKNTLDLILYGDNDFEGVIPWLERRYHSTESDSARKEIEKYMVEKKCETCQGKRLKPEALAVKVAAKTIDVLVKTPILELQQFFRQLEKTKKLSETDFKIARLIVKEIINRLQFLIDVGLDYLTLDRKSSTLAGGEEQRVRLATQIGTQLSGVLYILDEPSIGLHSRDQKRLVKTLKKLKNLKNTVLVVEHDPQTIISADWIIDLGPGAGKHGGKITFYGTPKKLLKSSTLTGKYISGKEKVEINLKPKIKSQKFLEITGAQEHNLKNINVKIPLEKFVCICGVSGSGKSSLMNDVLARALMKKFYNAKKEPGKHKAILGTENLNKVVLVDQSPIGRTPRSNPATYIGAFTYIRYLFSKTRQAKVRGYSPGRFSFNVKGGRCEECGGDGVKKIEMYFLPDIFVQCQECKGKRYNKETLEIKYKEKNISEVLEMTVEEALEFFKNIPPLYRKLKVLNDVGLGYIQLGQPAPSLSGGEAQRVKLALELSKVATGKTFYILDEPTTGLHPYDIKKLILVLKRLVEKKNTVLIIEHNLDVIKNADWIIDLGPEGGEKGGHIIAEGEPKKITKNKKSYTARFLKKALKN
ncbi:MAG: excinuclease ABC subunit A [candidate division Zixibacteria bacterium SM23_73]|nr:MAG: excinuclease ABC subunit A [candidate division Zixibacteria bacterium SM23_73]